MSKGNPLFLYNSLTRRKEEFRPQAKTVNLYTCGPTVYDYAHIGNLRTFVFYDVLERTLEFLGYSVHRVMNITDVGHLTSDADEGEDKMDKAAAREHKSVEDLINLYTDAFQQDLQKLNVKIPAELPRASQNMPAQIELVKILLAKGFAYDTPEAVYFDTTKFPTYGHLSGQSLAEKTTGARAEVNTQTSKKHPTDFALWFKRVGRFKTHLQHWPAPWGEGFPGWHVECSALIKKFLGQPIDLHAGGVDHIGTHHENELAQSEAAYGVPLAKVWLHAEHLIINDSRMAKSAGSFYTLTDAESRGFNPLALRYLYLQSHYRSKLNFTWESLGAAETGWARLVTAAWPTKDQKSSPELTAGFKSNLADDLNTPGALALLANQPNYRLLNILGLMPKSLPNQAVPLSELPAPVGGLVRQREQARANQQFKQSDALRKKIETLGYLVEDTPEGPRVYWRSQI